MKLKHRSHKTKLVDHLHWTLKSRIMAWVGFRRKRLSLSLVDSNSQDKWKFYGRMLEEDGRWTTVKEVVKVYFEIHGPKLFIIYSECKIRPIMIPLMWGVLLKKIQQLLSEFKVIPIFNHLFQVIHSNTFHVFDFSDLPVTSPKTSPTPESV